MSGENRQRTTKKKLRPSSQPLQKYNYLILLEKKAWQNQSEICIGLPLKRGITERSVCPVRGNCSQVEQTRIKLE